MSQTKQASKRKRKALSVSVLSVAGMSLAASTGSQAGMPSPGTARSRHFWVRRRFLTSAWRHSTLPVKKIPEHRGPYSTSPEGGADAVTDAADAATDAADSATDAIRPRMRFRRIRPRMPRMRSRMRVRRIRMRRIWLGLVGRRRLLRLVVLTGVWR